MSQQEVSRNIERKSSSIVLIEKNAAHFCIKKHVHACDEFSDWLIYIYIYLLK